MPGASAPFLDLWAPAQYVPGTSGAFGPLRSPDTDNGAAMNGNGTYDSQITVKIASTIVLALVVVFVLQASGFRFVVAAG